MISITTLGTGVSEDPDRINTSYIVEFSGKTIQVDAGYNVFGSLCRYLGGLDALRRKPDMILLTHKHGDHIGSLPQEILGMWRACNDADAHRDLYLTGERNAVESFQSSSELDYSGFIEKLYKDRIHFNVEPFANQNYFGANLTSAQTKHSAPNNAYRFDLPEGSFAISGDGHLTAETRRLFEGVDVLFHDGFNVEISHPSHASLKELVEYAKSARIKKFGIVHMDAPERKKIDR